MMSILVTTVVVLGGIYFLALRGFSAPLDHFDLTPMPMENEDGSFSWQVSIINLIFKDKTITYSMREEGIFCP